MSLLHQLQHQPQQHHRRRSLSLLLAATFALPFAIQAEDKKPDGAQVPSIAELFDDDHVLMFYPSAPGAQFRLGKHNPNNTRGFVIEKKTKATAGKDGALEFWNLSSHPLSYASGGEGWSSRLHIYASGGQQKFNWKNQRGFLSHPAELKNQEMTIFMRVHQILDPARAQISLKIRGGAHSDKNPDAASCVMLTLSPEGHGSVTRFGKELRHPRYDYVALKPEFTAALQENVWIGMKLISWNDPHDTQRVIHRLYLDTDPFDLSTGLPKNNWRLFSEYIDVEGKRTGQYSKLVNWGGWETTFRTDGFHDVDFAYPSVREIVVPQ